MPAQLAFLLKRRTNRQNLRTLMHLLMLLVGLITVFSILFHILMLREGHNYSWLTGVYWTLTVMSTLGFGDITFHSDLGRMFSICVLLTGTVFLLVLFPFTFIQFFYAPWIQSQFESRAPRQLPKETKNHIILTHYDTTTQALINKLIRFNHTYYVLTPDINHAMELYDLGINVVVGEFDDPETYRKIQIQNAALIALSNTDAVNTHIAFTVRDLAPKLPIIATVSDDASVDILQLAGCSRVLQLDEMLGRFLARRALGGDVAAHVVGTYNNLLIAETTVANTPLENKTLLEIGLRKSLGLTVVGIWERGQFKTAFPDTVLKASMVLLLAGSQEQIDKYNELYSMYQASSSPVVIIGGGEVGCAAARTLVDLGLDYKIIEQNPDIVEDNDQYILGNAAELSVLQAAGIEHANTVIITSHDDDINVYLTLYCRRLTPGIQVISRVTHERNIATLHRAGADFVMSYASMGADAIFNILERNTTLMVAEGLDVFKVPIPTKLINKTIAEAEVRRQTECTIIALETDDHQTINPDPHAPLPKTGNLILIGNIDAEKKFLSTFVHT